DPCTHCTTHRYQISAESRRIVTAPGHAVKSPSCLKSRLQLKCSLPYNKPTCAREFQGLRPHKLPQAPIVKEFDAHSVNWGDGAGWSISLARFAPGRTRCSRGRSLAAADAGAGAHGGDRVALG